MMKKQYHARGFTLIEVMLALLILALGILGISKLQGTLVKNTSDANQRAVAIALAQKKIDDLRSYAELDMSGASDWACPGTPLAAASLAYADITDDAGGAPLCDGNLLASDRVKLTSDPTKPNPILIGNTNYYLNWDVTPYEFVANVATAMADASSASPTVDFKEVQISVSWLDIATGSNASVAVSTIVDAYNPALTSLAGTTSAGGESIYPTYTPEAAPDVIDVEVDTGNGSKRQTSKPLPDAVKTGADANTIVSFEVVTYQTHPLDNTKFTATRQEEYITVDCKCTLAADAYAYPPAHSVWDDAEKERYDYVAAPISKPTATQTNNANDADEICTTCCRDHHDSASSPVKYSPDGSSHIHYNSAGTAATIGQEYTESCRLKLVDGIYRVFQDWNLIDLTVLERSQLVDGASLQTQYASYAVQTLIDVVDSTSAAVKPPLRTPINTAVGTNNLQLESRGIYLDNVYDLLGALSTEYATYVGDSSNTDRLEKVPFSEVNLTLLSGWTSASTAAVTVRNDPVATISDPVNDYYGTFERGVLDILTAIAAPGVDVTSTISDSNEGITQNAGNNPGALTYQADTVAIIASGTPATDVDVTGTITISSSDGSNIGGYKPTVSPSGSCVFDSGGSNNFTCTISSGSNITIQASAEKSKGSLTCSLVQVTLNNVTSNASAGTFAVDCTS